MENNKSKLSEEYLRKFKHRTEYLISETPKYRPLVTSNEEFDEVPMLEAGEQEDAEKPEGQVPPAPSNDVPQGAEQPPTPPPLDAQGGAPAPEAGMPPEGEPMDSMGEPVATPGADPMGDPMAPNPQEAEHQVDDLQNEIIKYNIEAMKGIASELANLSATQDALNAKLDALNADVEEVREPTSGEKLMNKTDVSYPYYFNLNDMWGDNWFEQKRAEEQSGGIKELPDGTYVADFDDLPQKSKIDVQNSFNDIV